MKDASIATEWNYADIAAFIDIEQHEGTLAATRAYPDVWLRLLHESDLAEIYHITRLLVDAQAKEELASPEQLLALHAAPYRTYLHLITLQQSFVRAFLASTRPPDAHMGTETSKDMTLAEQELPGGHNFVFHIRQNADTSWRIKTTLFPPVRGWLVLSLGNTVIRAPFDDTGTAVVSAVAANLLTPPDAETLSIGIETEPEEEP